MIGGLQGIVDHVMVGHYVGFTGNAAIGVGWQIFLVVVVFISSLFTGMGVLVARFAGANDHEKVNRVVYQAFLTAVLLALGVLAPIGYLVSPTLLELVHATPEVRAEALPYLRTMFVCSIGQLLYFMIAGALRAAGDARTGLRTYNEIRRGRGLEPYADARFDEPMIRIRRDAQSSERSAPLADSGRGEPRG